MKGKVINMGFWKNLPNEETPINADNLSRSERYLQATASANGDFFVDINGADGLTEGDVVRIMFPSSANPQEDARLSIDGGSNYNFIAINENIKKAESVENDKLELVYDGENWQIILTSENIKRPDNSTVEESLQILENDTGWIDLGYGSGFTVSSFGYPPQIRKIGNVVYMRGICNRGTNISNGEKPMGTIPEGFRPSAVMYFQVRGTGGKTLSIQINANGTSSIAVNEQTSAYIALDSISYPLD
jgi:hypothetical protein